jgi:hypothetical protein
MNSFLKGFLSLFSWFDCYNNLSPSERVDEILDDFYFDHPYIERDDLKALEKDFKKIWENYN